MDSIKTCGNCGRLLPGNARVGSTCPHCGARFGSEKISFKYSGGGKTSSGILAKVVIAIAAAALLVGAIGISAYFRHRKAEAGNATLGYSHGWSRSFKGNDLRAIALSPDGGRAAAVVGSSLILMDASTGKPLAEREIGDKKIYSMRFDLEGASLGIFKDDGLITLDLSLRENQAKAIIPWGPVLYSSDGSTAYVDPAGNIVIYDRRSRTLVSELKGGKGEVVAIALSKDGKTLAAAEKKRVRVWELPSGRLAWSRATNGELSFLGFDEESKTLYSGTPYANLNDPEAWEAATGKPLKKTRNDLYGMLPYGDAVSALSIPSTGVIAYTSYGRIYFFELYGLKALASPVETTLLGTADRNISLLAADAAGNLLCGTCYYDGNTEYERCGLVLWKALPSGSRK